MKGVSTIIATLMILVIVLALGGLAYTFISGTTTQRIAVILEVDASITQCDATTDVITIGVRNSGTSSLPLSSVIITGANSTGGVIPSVSCSATGTLAAGGRATCGNTVTGSDGNNNIIVSAGGSSASGVVFCI